MDSEKIVSKDVAKDPLEANKIKSRKSIFIVVSIILFFLAGVAQAEPTKADVPKIDAPTDLRDELYNMTEISAKVIIDRDEAAVEARVPLKGNRIEWVK